MVTGVAIMKLLALVSVLPMYHSILFFDFLAPRRIRFLLPPVVTRVVTLLSVRAFALLWTFLCPMSLLTTVPTFTGLLLVVLSGLDESKGSNEGLSAYITGQSL